jgi:hypothetical protein
MHVCSVPNTNMARGAALYSDHNLSQVRDVSLTSAEFAESAGFVGLLRHVGDPELTFCYRIMDGVTFGSLRRSL